MKFSVPVGVSSRHVHLTEEHIAALFGPGYQLTKKKDLTQPGQFACEETVTLVGPKGKLEGVRILGPARKASQVELAITDTFKLGVKAPIRDSGQHEGTPGIKIIGPKGEIELQSGVIVAARHIHMTPEQAQAYNLKDGDYVKVVVDGERGGVFGRVLIRVRSDYALDFHIDTDEGNAFALQNGQIVTAVVDE